VRVRFLVDDSFSLKYPKTTDELTGIKGLQMRKLVAGNLFGGILHAKYFVIDRKEGYLGSQNFDWRSLEHIQEMGVRIRSPELSAELLDVFETDWELAGGAPKDFRMKRHKTYGPVRIGDDTTATLTANPTGWLPDEASWDLPQIIERIDAAKKSVAVQVLTYKLKGYGGDTYTGLDDALRRAAQRGVKVRLLVSDWSNKLGSDARRDITELAKVPGIEVRVITIPPWSGGFIPFARVCHSKFMVVDGETSWVGTSNWEGDYFFKSRNVGIIIESQPFTAELTHVFDDSWDAKYTKQPDPMPAGEKPLNEWKKKDFKADPEPMY
jgi:phosphatidylserine/phosphatidylglycerophosphate/cardiolipin synthase-like enzyme